MAKIKVIFLGVLVMVVTGCNLPTIAHQIRPGIPMYEQFIADCNTGENVEPGELIQPIPGCDNWEINRYERPFNRETQDEYYPDLDVLFAELGRDGTWFYLNLALFDVSEDTQQLDGTYGIEIDWDRDGRGDILIVVDEPGKIDKDEWSVLGVQVWKDNNNDVGNDIPKEPDSPYLGDGYNLLAFDQGEGSDPDAAWARAKLGQSAYVEMAFKTTLLDNPVEFVWWVWSDQGVANVAGFDYHDKYARAEAGDANEFQPYFPSDQVHGLDNTCASLWGLPPDDDPSLCVNDPNFARRDCPPMDYDAFLAWWYPLWGSPPLPTLPPHHEAVVYEEYTKYACGDPRGTATPTRRGLTPWRDTPPTGTLETPTWTLETPKTPETPTPSRTSDVPCDFDCECEDALGENPYNCPKDCPEHCGNDMCDCGENPCTCKKDCGKPDPGDPCCECGDGVCIDDCRETCKSCPSDCGPCPCECGDGKCDKDCNENPDSCPEDCDPGGAAPGGP